MSNDLAHIFRLCSFGRFGNHTVAITQVLGRFQQHNLVACWNERGAFFISSLYSSAQKITLKGAPFFARALVVPSSSSLDLHYTAVDHDG